MTILSAAGLIVATLLTPVIAAAGESVTFASLARGEKVRLRLTSDREPVYGTIDAAGPGEIVVRREDPALPALRLSPQQMKKLEVARGRRSHWGVGAAVGFVPGAFLGVAAAMNAECDPNCDHTGEAVGYALVAGAVTASLGALVGLAIRTDRWVRVEDRPAKLSLSLAPANGGFRAGLSLSF